MKVYGRIGYHLSHSMVVGLALNGHRQYSHKLHDRTCCLVAWLHRHGRRLGFHSRAAAIAVTRGHPFSKIHSCESMSKWVCDEGCVIGECYEGVM